MQQPKCDCANRILRSDWTDAKVSSESSLCTRWVVNPFMPNVFYQLDESISNFRVVGGIFHFIQILKETSVSSSAASDLVCTVCRCPTKRALDLHGLSTQPFFMRTAMSLIIRGRCPGCSEHSLLVVKLLLFHARALMKIDTF